MISGAFIVASLSSYAGHFGAGEVEVGELGPDEIHLPGIFVQRIVELAPEQVARKGIEKRTVRAAGEAL